MMKAKRSILIYITAAAMILVLSAVSVCIGKYEISPAAVGNILIGTHSDAMDEKVVLMLRIPRTAMTVIAGISFGLAGSVYQIVFKNPLASPDIIGVASGANLGAAAAIAISSGSMAAISTGAFWGGAAAVTFVLLLVRFTESRSMATYVLAGVVINSIARAAIMSLKYFADPENELAAMDYWEMGTFGNVTAAKIITVLPLFLTGLVGLFLLRRQIMMMLLSDEECRAMGMNLTVIRTAVLALSTLMVSSVISITGLISFVGLIAPHLARLLLKRTDTKTMLLSSLAGGIIVLLADIGARTAYSGELPVSILTTAVGVPVLVFLMVKRGRERI